MAESHLIPKFVFKWMKKSGGNYFRSALNPNVRMQDGFKQHLLCFECEQKFSKYEKWFADNIFHPHVNGKKDFLDYNENLGNFIVSVLWRRLLLNKINNEPYLEEVFNDWHSYLNGDSEITFDDIHLLFLGDMWNNKNQPHEFIHRYFTRAADTNIAEIDNDTIVFAKFSRFIVLAQVNNTDDNFRGTKVLFKKSRFPFVQFVDNGKVALFFMERAKAVFQLALSRISKKEQEKIIQEINKDTDQFWKSDAGSSISKDMQSNIVSYEVDERFRYVCDCCFESLYAPSGYLLRTFEIIQSSKYWRNIFIDKNYGVDNVGLEKRIEAFKSVTSSPSPWVICDKCIDWFDVERDENKEYMNNWISDKAKYIPPKCDDFRNYISEEGVNQMLNMIVSIQ
ncbi:hypothetical protein ACXIHB_15035 [Tenacibaculum sp. IMCC1]